MASRGPSAPRPPADFAFRNIEPIDIEGPYFRVTKRGPGEAIHFSRGELFRFDFAGAKYGVCYLGLSEPAAIMETFGERLRRRQTIALSDLQATWIYELERFPIKGCPFFGSNLTVMGATAQVLSGAYPAARAWSKAIMEHPADFMGIVYTGRLCQQLCCALFGEGRTLSSGQPLRPPVKVWRVADSTAFWQLATDHDAKVDEFA